MKYKYQDRCIDEGTDTNPKGLNRANQHTDEGISYQSEEDFREEMEDRAREIDRKIITFLTALFFILFLLCIALEFYFSHHGSIKGVLICAGGAILSLCMVFVFADLGDNNSWYGQRFG